MKLSCELEVEKPRADRPQVRKGPAALLRFADGETEAMTETKHAILAAERFLSGWTQGDKRDKDKKVTPYLVDWSDLPEDIRDYDRQTVRKMPELLAGVGMRVCRSQK